MITDSPLIFFSYASPDRERVMQYFDQLKSRGFNVWMDHENLKAGQHWDFEIRKALDKAIIIVVFISNNSVDKRGYVQREIRLSIDKLEEKLVTDIFIIPVLLDSDVPIPVQLKHLHCVKGWEDQAHAAIEDSINHQLSVIGVEVKTTQDKSNLNWSKSKYQEKWEGLPGYELEYNILNIYSSDYPKVSEITSIIKGHMISLMMDGRKSKFNQEPERMNFGQNKWSRTNTLEAYCADPVIVENVISIQYNIYWYGAGAAHPNSGCKTFSFTLDPVTQISELSDIFSNVEQGFAAIQQIVRTSLIDQQREQSGDNFVDNEWIERGTKDWSEFKAFIFMEEGILLIFPPYQVDCYAAGTHFVNIDYEHIVLLMKQHFIDALGLSHLIWKLQKKAQ